jgi:cell division septation protein DedD
MDIANYLSELLGRQGEISVPGLGHFVHVRVSAWYNDAERKFYPPGYKIQFDPQVVDGDDTLTKYIAEKKKISLASSKYFTDKYISALKQEAALQEVPFAGLGWFFMDKGKIAFKSKISNADSASFYGYAPISIKKLNQPEITEVPVETPETVSAPAITPIQEPADNSVSPPEPMPLPRPIREIPEETADQPVEYFDDEPEEKRGISAWAIILVVVIILASAGLTIYKFKPQWLHLNNGQEILLPPVTKAPPVVKHDTDSVKKAMQPADTTNKAILKPDSSLKKANVATTQADSSTGPVFAVILGSFKTVKKAQIEADIYQKKGVDARVYSGPGTGKLIKVVTGSFGTYEEAKAQKDRLVKEKKIEITSYPYQLVKHQK